VPRSASHLFAREPRTVERPTGQGPAGGLRFRRSVFHAPFIDAEPRLELATVVTSDLRRRDEVVEHHPSATVAVNLDEALASDVDYSLAVVTTPTPPRADRRDAARPGIPLVVDKPVARPRAGPATRRLAEEHGAAVVPFRTGATTRTSVPSSACSRQARSGPSHGSSPAMSAGSPRSTLRAHGDGRRTPTRGRQRDHLRPRGAPRRPGVVLFGHPERVYAEIATRRPGARVNDDVFIALSYPGASRPTCG